MEKHLTQRRIARLAHVRLAIACLLFAIGLASPAAVAQTVPAVPSPVAEPSKGDAGTDGAETVLEQAAPFPAEAATEAPPAPRSQPASAARQESTPTPRRVRVLVAVTPFRIHSAQPLGYLEQSLPDLLSSRLEASGRIEVVEAVIVREALVDYAAGELTELSLRRLAQELGADYVVSGSLTELAGNFSLDVRVTPVASDAASETMVFTADSEDGLLDRINELSDRLVSSLVAESRGLVKAIVLEGEEALPPGRGRPQLETRVGGPYDSEIAARDLAHLRGLPGVATATLEVDRQPEGVTVTFRVVPEASLFGAGTTPADDGERVFEIRIRGNRRIEADAIRARISLRPGDPYRADRIAQDVLEVNALGFFRNVQVFSEESPDGRIVTFQVEENPVVRRVSITGNDSVDGDRIRDALTLTTGSTLDYPLLFENRARIEALYRAQGFYLASVRYEIQNISEGAVAIDFEVQEGRKLRLQDIVFEGNTTLSDDELRKGMKTKPWRWHSHATRFLTNAGTYSEPVFLQDLRGVEDKYANAGFIQVEVTEPEIETTPEGLLVRVSIQEGDRYSTGTLEVAGDETIDLEGLQSKLNLKEGETFDRSGLTRDVDVLTQHYTDRGFYFASVNPRTQVDPVDKRVDVVFQVEKGPLYFVREIEFVGNSNTVDTVLRQEMEVVEGQLYSARAVNVSRVKLQRLGFFEEVNLEPVQTTQPEELDLEVRVVERPTGSLSFGAGFSSQDQFVLNGSLSQSNLFGRGWAVQASVDWGGRSNRFFLSFSDNHIGGTDWGISGTVFRTEVEFEDFEQQQTGLDLTFSHALDRQGNSRGFLRYNFSSRDLTDDSNVNASSPIFRQILAGSQTTSLLGISFRADTRDDRVVPSRGYQLSASAEFAGLGGFSRFIRFEGRVARYWRAPEFIPYLGGRSTFSATLRAGWAIPFNEYDDWDIDSNFSGDSGLFASLLIEDEVRFLNEIDGDIDLPLTERYFLGGLGSFTLRGFRARSVGPRRAVLARSGLFGTGDRFTPVGRDPATGLCLDDAPNTAGNPTPVNFQGDGDGQCNSLDDERIDDFDDLDETDVIGGNKFFSLSLEYRFPISEQLGLLGIVFFDMGNAFYEGQSVFDVSDWRYGTGVGALWFSPFGPLQVFWGFPINKLEVEDSNVFEFSVGGANF
jgi:outer membrane protein insertion porin family